jgi:predicted dehydrogenase
VSNRNSFKLSPLSRRQFLRGAAFAFGALAATGGAPALLSAPKPNYKLGIAVIGCGGMGSANPGIAAGERLVALADVDDGKLADAVRRVAHKVPNPRAYHDYRRMLDECHPDIDAVLIATPDHHHAPAAMRAIHYGKHVFVQKPLAHNLYEARALTQAAKARKVATQMGNQGHSADGYRILCEYIWAGAIGKVRETHSLLERNFGGAGGRPPSKPVPPGLHWDEWLGPAPFREYHDGLHPFDWRSWTDFGTGNLGDMGCHTLDGVFWALELDEAPAFTVECLQQNGGSAERHARDNIIRWEFPSEDDQPPVKVYSYDSQWPEFVQELERKLEEKFRGGTLYVGEKGCMFTGPFGDNPRVIPQTRQDDFRKPKDKIKRSPKGMMGDFFQACRGKGAASSNFSVAGPLTEMALTGVLASRAGPGKKIEWDVEKLQCVNRTEVNQWVKRDYRPGWEV